MTQMLLFDSPPTENRVVPVAESSETAGGKNVAAEVGHESGLHHMGDLARLVLLRYELVARRRALLAARRAAEEVMPF